MSQPNIFEQNELVFSRNENGNIISGGYKLDLSYTGDNQIGGGFSSLAVPAGLLFLQQNYNSISSKINDKDVIPESLYDKLLQLKSIPKSKFKSKSKKYISRLIRNKTYKKR